MNEKFVAYSYFGDRLLILLDIVKLLPKRLSRFVLHVFWFVPHNSKLPVGSIIDWILDLPFYILDILGVGEIYQFVNLVFKPKLRKINLTEEIIISEVFDNCLDVNKVWIDDKARMFTSKFAHAYVTTNMVNYWESIGDKIFVHELVHVCQYQKFGSVYISRALRGQFSKDGYDYGGVFGLSKALAQGKRYLEFNFEQQAQIVEDYYEVKNRMDLLINPLIVNTYGFYYEEMKKIYAIS